LVITKGQERCLYVFPLAEFRRVTENLRSAPVTAKAVRDYSRVLFAGASDEVPDKQGRITLPPALRSYAGLERDCVGTGAGARPGRPGAAGEDGTGHGLQTRMGTGWRDFPGARRYRVWRPLQARPGEQGTAQGAPARRGEREREGSVLMGDTGIGADPGADDRAEHVPVMLDRIVELLAPALQEPGAVLVDGTLGLGGHAEAMLTALPGLRLVGIDRDTSALRRSRARLAPFAGRTEFAHAEYDALPRVLDDL